MVEITNQELIKKAKEIVKVCKLSEFVTIGYVGCALVTKDGKVYLGVSIDACCGIGFCAEHSAISSMVLDQKYKIKKIVAVNWEGKVIPPCGRCRELMYQISEDNCETEILVDDNKVVKLKELLPDPWQKKI